MGLNGNQPSGLPIVGSVVLQVVAEAYGLQVYDLTCEGRVRRPGPDARRVAARLLHEESRYSWDRVAEIMNRHPDWLGKAAASADPGALEQLRRRLHSNGQTALW